MENLNSLVDDHKEPMERDEAFKSIAMGGWDEGNGVANLKVTSGTMELQDEQRVPEGTRLDEHYTV